MVRRSLLAINYGQYFQRCVPEHDAAEDEAAESAEHCVVSAAAVQRERDVLAKIIECFEA